MCCELGTLLFSDQIATISIDDMAKVKVGALAVNSYHQIKHFFAKNDTSNLKDCDFPVPGYLLMFSGHMILNLDEKMNDRALNESNVVQRLTNSEPSFKTWLLMV